MESLNRFLEAQENVYGKALSEIKSVKKVGHWMWFIFPQIIGLGESPISLYYAIQNIEEAKAYLEHDILGIRLMEISTVLLKLEGNDPEEIFGFIDAMKLKSCMTLFDYISEDYPFYKILEKYYQGEKDNKTLEIIKQFEKRK